MHKFVLMLILLYRLLCMLSKWFRYVSILADALSEFWLAFAQVFMYFPGLSTNPAEYRFPSKHNTARQVLVSRLFPYR